MLDDKGFESAIQELIMDICEVMYRRGYDTVCIGHIMRLVGVPEDRASKHDQEYFSLDEEFQALLEDRDRKQKPKNKKKTPRHTPDGVTLH